MPILNWLTREDDIQAVKAVPYRLLEEVADLSYGAKDTGNMLIQEIMKSLGMNKTCHRGIDIEKSCDIELGQGACPVFQFFQVAHLVCRPDLGNNRGPADDTGDNAEFFQFPDNADVRPAARGTAAQRQADTEVLIHRVHPETAQMRLPGYP